MPIDPIAAAAAPMNWMAFTVALVQALAWPVTVVVVFLLLRRKLTELLPLLRQLKWKDFELTFGDKVRELAAEVGDSLPPATSAPSLPEGDRSHLDNLARLSPRSAIIEAWIPVEHAALTLATRRGVSVPKDANISGRGVMEALQSAAVVNSEETRLFRALRSLRNEAAHTPDFAPSRDATTEYIDLAQRLASLLESR